MMRPPPESEEERFARYRTYAKADANIDRIAWDHHWRGRMHRDHVGQAALMAAYDETYDEEYARPTHEDGTPRET